MERSSIIIDNQSIIPWILMIDYKIKHFDYRGGNIDFLRDLICIKLSWPKTSPWILFNVIINIIFSLTINIILGFSRFNRSLHSIHKQIFVGYMYYFHSLSGASLGACSPKNPRSALYPRMAWVRTTSRPDKMADKNLWNYYSLLAVVIWMFRFIISKCVVTDYI